MAPNTNPSESITPTKKRRTPRRLYPRGPDRGLIPHRAFGLFRPDEVKTTGAFGGCSKIERDRRAKIKAQKAKDAESNQSPTT